MKQVKLTAQQIADYLGGYVEGNPDIELSGFSGIEKGTPSDLSFLSNRSYEHFLYETKCGAVLVDKDFHPTSPTSATLIRVNNAYEALAVLLQYLKEREEPKSGISSLAVVEESAEIDPTAYIGPLAYVGERTKIGPRCIVLPQAHIGKDCILEEKCKVYPLAVICDRTSMGKRCIIHSGAIIGADGFGYAPTEEGYNKIPQTGYVVLEDDVEIGSNTCIDRAVLNATILHKGVKVDNLVQLAHNTEVCQHTVIAAQSGVAGSTKIGAWNQLGGQVGISGHLTTCDKATFAAQSGVISSIKTPGVYFGSPAQPHHKAMRAAAKFISLPEMSREINQLCKEVKALRAELELLKKENEQTTNA